MSVSAKMSVDTSGFVNGMNQAATSIKTLNAQLKQNEAALKLTGNQEAFVAAQSGTLNRKMQEEQKTVERLTKALADLDKKGTDPNNKSYQKLQQQLAQAQTNLMGTQARIQELGSKSGEAAGKTDKLSSSVASIGKKMSLDQAISGIDRITSGLEAGAKKALELGKNLWNGIEESAAKADDIATQATILGMDIEDYQRYYKVFETIGDITVSDWRKAKKKVQAAINNPSEEQTNIFNLLGIQTHEGYQGKYGYVEGVARNFEDILWEAGEELRRRVDADELSADLADIYSNALFGKSFDNLNPLFKLGRTAFDEALKNQNVTSQEAIDKLAALNDELIKTKGDFESLKMEVLSGMAPALTKAAQVLDSLLGRVMEYLKTPEGKKALESLETSVAGLFEDLGQIDPGRVVEGFTNVFNQIVGGIQWLVENKDTAADILKAILISWGAFELTGDLLKFWQLINGIFGLTGSAATSAASAAGAAVGASWGGAFAAAALAAAPWLLAILAAKAIPDENKVYREERVQAADATREQIELLKTWAEVQNELAEVEARWGFDDFDEGKYAELAQRASELGNKVQSGDLWDKYWDYVVANDLHPGSMPVDVLEKMLAGMSGDAVEIPAEFAVPDDEASKLSDDIGTVTVPIQFIPINADIISKYGILPHSHANGIWNVPSDNYLAFLHAGERVVPAREVSNRSYNSNLYVEKMIMNNNQDAEGLAGAMAARQRRTMRGFGQ